MKFDRNTTISRDGEDVEINVEYDATPYISATYWGPAEGGEIEIPAVTLEATGAPLGPPLTEDEESKVLDYLYESMDESDFDGPEDYE